MATHMAARLVWHDRGWEGRSIGGDSLADEPPMLACLALPGKPVTQPAITTETTKLKGAYGRDL
jgi:hypothetical protein